MADLSPDPSAPFPELLGHLVQLYRGTPEREDAIRQALELVTARIASGPALIEAGIENSWALDGDPLKERLQLRQVDSIRVAAGATSGDLLALARALADDSAPIPSTAQVQVKLLPEPLPLAFSGPRPGVPDAGGERAPRARPGDQLAQVIEGILNEMQDAVAQGQWHVVLHDAQAAGRMLPGLKEEARRTFAIALKRLLAPPVVQALIEQAYRIPEEQARTAEVLRLGGYPAADLVLGVVQRADTIGPRGFLVDALGAMPEVFPLLAPLLQSERVHEARLAAELLGRLQTAEALPLLLAQVRHPDQKVRIAVIEALGRYRDKGVVESLRLALTHSDPVTRTVAARALASRGSGAMAMPLLAALDAERDPTTWEELLGALAAIDAPEAASALARIATERAGMFGGSQRRRQVAVVRALGAADTPAARQALRRVAAEGSGEVKRVAEELLGEGGERSEK
jgi:HEAT repeats